MADASHLIVWDLWPHYPLRLEELQAIFKKISGWHRVRIV